MSLYENGITDISEKPKVNNLPKVAFVGVCFTSLFTAYIASQNLASHIYTDLGFAGLGSACVLNIYCFQAIGSIFASHVKRSLSHKAGFMIGASCYTLFVLAGLFTAHCGQENLTTGMCDKSAVYALNLIATIFVGSGASIIWLTQSDYVNQCADDSTKGLYNGVFWSLMQMSQIIGSVLSTVLMKYTTTFNLYAVLFCFGVCSVIMFSFTPKVTPATEQPVQEFEPLSKSVGKFFNTLGNPKYAFMMTGMTLVGIAIAYYANFLSQVVEDAFIAHNPIPVAADFATDALYQDALTTFTTNKNGNVGYALVALAVGEVSAGLVIGRLGDVMKKTHVFQICIVIAEIGLGLCFLAHFTNVIGIAFVAGYFWGFCDTGLNTILGSIIGAYYDGSLELFSLMRFLTGVGAAFGSGLALAVGGSQVVVYSAVVAGVIGLLHVIFLVSSRGLNWTDTPKHALLADNEQA